VGQVRRSSRVDPRQSANAGTLHWIEPVGPSDWRRVVIEEIWRITESYARAARQGATAGWAGGPPRQAVSPRVFGGRSRELERVEAAVQGALRSRPDHLLVTGPPGVGKSSFLRKAEEKVVQTGCLAIRREIPSSVESVPALSDFLMRAVQDALRRHLPSGQVAVDALSTFWIEHEFVLPLPGLGGSLGIKRRARYDAFDPDHFSEYLERFWRQAERRGIRGLVFLLDDADALSKVSGSWAFLRGVSTRLTEHGARHLFVLAARAGDAAGETATVGAPDRFFTVLPLRPMTREETGSAVERVLKVSELSATPATVTRIYGLSGGHPYGVQTVSYHAARAAVRQGRSEVTPDLVDEIVPQASRELEDQIFRPLSGALSVSERNLVRQLARTGRGTSGRRASTRSGARRPSRESVTARALLERGLLVQDESGHLALRGELMTEYFRSRGASPGP
jgi:AAA ATPase domain